MIQKIRFNVSCSYYEDDGPESFRDGIRDFRRGIEKFVQKHVREEPEDGYEEFGSGYLVLQLKKAQTQVELSSTIEKELVPELSALTEFSSWRPGEQEVEDTYVIDVFLELEEGDEE